MKLLAFTAICGLLLRAQDVAPGEQPLDLPTFGVSVVLSAGLTGQIYEVKENTRKLPDFKKQKLIGTIYTYSLAIEPRDFKEGFPGITDRFEWFAIDYTGRFWVDQPGEYRFILTSDDGSRLSIDGKRIVNNDGEHPAVAMEGRVTLKQGVHTMRVEYFQGPRFHVALLLEVAPPGGEPRIFDTQEFRPPSDYREP